MPPTLNVFLNLTTMYRDSSDRRNMISWYSKYPLAHFYGTTTDSRGEDIFMLLNLG